MIGIRIQKIWKMAMIPCLPLEWGNGKCIKQLNRGKKVGSQKQLFIKVFCWFIYRNANKGDHSDFISVKGDVEMDLDINKEMTRDQEEAMMNS